MNQKSKDVIQEKITCKYCNQALLNEKFLNEIESNYYSDFNDWKITIIFYTSVHFLKSYAKIKNIELNDHVDTFNKLYSQGKGLPPVLKLDSSIVSN